MAVLGSARVDARPANHAAWTPSSYLVYYGDWDASTVRQALDFELVILQPNGITRPLVEQLQAGRDGRRGTADDVRVLAYVSLGEDETPPRGLAAPDAGAGPVHRVGASLVGDGNEFPTYYLDEVRLVRGADGFFALNADGERKTVPGQDGLPDENGVWGSYYTAAGDPGWAERIHQRTREVEEKLQPDGFFLDTLDTASRWGPYPWMEKDMVSLVSQVRAWNPEALLVANRGLSLFYDDGPVMRAALDGVMYESFVTDWDWQRMIGVPHPVLADQVEVLRDLVLPQATAPDGFFLLFLNYRAPGQPDFINFLHQERELLKGVACATYWTTPDLQKIDPAPASYFPAQGPVLAGLEAVRAERTPTGVRLVLSASSRLGQDAFLDLVAGPAPSALAHRLRVVYPPNASGEVTLDLFGVSDPELWARLLGRAASQETEFQVVKVPGTGLPPVPDLAAHSLDGKIRLTWTGAPGGAYVVYAGPGPDQLKKVASANKPQAVVTGLVNDRAWAFSVGQVQGGKLVALSPVVYGAPHDRTPPPAPAALQVQGHEIRWSPVSAPDLNGYRVYVWPERGGLRLPLLAESDQTSLSVENARPGQRYSVFVTAVDESGNESHPAPRAWLAP